MRLHEFDGSNWDTRRIRRIRESGWFSQNEARMTEAARRQRAAVENKRHTAEVEFERLKHWHKCPNCGGDMELKTIEEVGVTECGSCAGIFFDRGELEELLLKHEEHRRGFFRRLLGFPKD